MKNNSILIISNNNDVGSLISNKIKLLRECDSVKIVSYYDSVSILNTMQPNIIILYSSNNDSTSILKDIRNIKALDKVPIIFVMDELNEDKLFYAFDNGIDDFFFLKDPDSIILMRIFLTLQKSILYKQVEINNQILISTDVIDKNSGIYKKDKANLVLREFFSKSIEENLSNTVFMYVKANVKNQKKLNMSKIASIAKRIQRADDIIAFGKGSGLYFILYNAGMSGARTVAERLKSALEEECIIHVNAASITTSFEEMESVLYQSMRKQIENDTDFVFIDDIKNTSITNNIEVKDEEGNKFQDFKKDFYKGFEKIVAPVFYQMENKLSEEYTNSKVKFDINENRSIFSISQDTIYSELEITYPTYIKILIDIKIEEENSSPIVKRLIYDFEDFSDEILTTLIIDLSREFNEKLSLSTIQQPE